MSETYQSKRERWQRLLETLPVGLREQVSLRNVEAVAALPPQAQERLAEAIQAGLKRLPRAVEQLRVNPDALGNADVMDVARTVAQAHHQLFKSNHLRTDFVVMVLYGLMRQSLESLEEVIEQTPALLQAFNQSSLPWKPNDWRKQNA